MWTEEAIAEFWQRNKADFAGDETARLVASMAKSYLGADMLDVGAGSGALLSILPGTVGLDIAPRRCEIIRGTVARLPFVDDNFDVVFATDLLEHLPPETLRGGLEEIRRVLVHGGRLIATVPYNEDFRQNMVWCPECHAEFHRWGHVNRFDKATLGSWLSGFRIVRLDVLPLRMMASHWLVRVAWRLMVRMGFCQSTDLFVVAVKQ